MSTATACPLCPRPIATARGGAHRELAFFLSGPSRPPRAKVRCVLKTGPSAEVIRASFIRVDSHSDLLCDLVPDLLRPGAVRRSPIRLSRHRPLLLPALSE